ncbi:MAG: hypothetical protein ACI88L_000254 [Candidatus Paceibacteria bacterium]|jgi:hypothetical protein
MKKKEPRGFGGDTFHKNGIARVERYFACSNCLDEESIKFSFMLPHSKNHNDRDYKFPCTICKMQTSHHDIGHVDTIKDLH